MNILSEVRRHLIKRLETITPANGYLTSAGTNVRSGWFNEVIKDQPIGAGMIVVQKGKGLAPKAGGAALRMMPGFSIIGAVEAGLDGYEDAIEALELDLLRCLTPIEGLHPEWLPKGSTTVIVGAPESLPPGEGLAAATVLVPININAFVDSIDY